MWAKIDPTIKTRLEAEYQKNKIEAAKEKEDYEAQYGKIERKKKKKHDKNKDKDEWFICHLPSYYTSLVGSCWNGTVQINFKQPRLEDSHCHVLS